MRVTPHDYIGLKDLNTMKGFINLTQPQRTAHYWIACYTQDNEDVPFGISKKILKYKPGQDKDKLIVKYCQDLMKTNRTIWELLVHQGPNEVPDHGDQITLRMSREKFRGSTTLS